MSNGQARLRDKAENGAPQSAVGAAAAVAVWSLVEALREQIAQLELMLEELEAEPAACRCSGRVIMLA